MTSTAIAIVLRPLLLLIVVGCVLLPARRAVQRYMPEGRLKRVLLFRISSAYDAGDSRHGRA